MIRILLLFFFLQSIQIAAQEQLQVKGFGALTCKQQSDGSYLVQFPRYGEFAFQGSLSPLHLRSNVAVQDLEKLPAYIILSNIGLERVDLEISEQGLSMQAIADTKKNLGQLFKTLNINVPTLLFNMSLDSEGFALSAGLDFSENPITISLLNGDFRLRHKKLSIEAAAGESIFNFGPSISVKLESSIKPSSWDPDLQIVMELSYDLLSQEITGAGSLVDTWKNPFGMANILKKDVLTIQNAALALGWIPGSPSPTTIGFSAERAEIFHLDFSIFLSIAPTDGKVALQAYRSEMGGMELIMILREGFGLKVPELFPKDISLKDVYFLFAPLGAEVGEFKLKPGFAIRAKANVLDAVEASVDFYLNMEQGAHLSLNIDAQLKEALMKEIRKVPAIAPIMKKVLSSLELHRVLLELSAAKDLELKGRGLVEASVLGKKIGFDIEGSFLPEAVLEELLKRVRSIAEGEARAIVRKLQNTASSAGRKSLSIASRAFREAADQAKTVSRHIRHTQSKCDNDCIPAHARRMARPILKGSNDAVDSFYDDIIADLKEIEGESQAQTKRLRREYIKPEWDKLLASIDSDWKKIRDDRAYVRFYLRPSSASAGGRSFRRLIDVEKNKHERYRSQVWQRLLSN